MKTTKLTTIALLASFAASTPLVFAQQSSGDSTLQPGRSASQSAVQPKTSAEENRSDAQRQQQTGSPQAAQQPAGQKHSVVQIISDADNLSMLEKCLKSAKLDQTLGDEQTSFTIFAPTNEAFEAIPAATLAKLMKDENRDQLRAILLNHVVAGKHMAADLKTGNMKTMSGETIQVTAAAGDVQIAGSRVSSPDMQASNGVIHTIGEVIIPKSVNVQELK